MDHFYILFLFSVVVKTAWVSPLTFLGQAAWIRHWGMQNTWLLSGRWLCLLLKYESSCWLSHCPHFVISTAHDHCSALGFWSPGGARLSWVWCRSWTSTAAGWLPSIVSLFWIFDSPINDAGWREGCYGPGRRLRFTFNLWCYVRVRTCSVRRRTCSNSIGGTESATLPKCYRYLA